MKYGEIITGLAIAECDDDVIQFTERLLIRSRWFWMEMVQEVYPYSILGWAGDLIVGFFEG